jgi:hypothetical protein
MSEQAYVGVRRVPRDVLGSFRRQRVRQEVFKGAEARGAHRSGTDGAAAVVLLTAAAAYGLYAYDTNVFTGLLLGPFPLPPYSAYLEFYTSLLMHT